MELEVILLGSGFLLSFILLILLVVLALQNGRPPQRSKVKTDLKKIKEQINGDKDSE